jgi:hypothetical protein
VWYWPETLWSEAEKLSAQMMLAGHLSALVDALHKPHEDTFIIEYGGE